MASKAKHGDRSKAVEPDATREHEIRRRAFEIYLEGGSEPGSDTCTLVSKMAREVSLV